MFHNAVSMKKINNNQRSVTPLDNIYLQFITSMLLLYVFIFLGNNSLILLLNSLSLKIK